MYLVGIEQFVYEWLALCTESQFEYQLRQDGGFDCVTKIVSMGANLFKKPVDKGFCIFNELEDDLQKEVDKTEMNFMCEIHNFDSVGHTLDYYDEDMTDIKNYIQKIK